MSISTLMVPVVMVAAATVKGEDWLEPEKPIETIFNDSDLLAKTLNEHGVPVNIISENEIHVKSGGHELRYERANSSEAFVVTPVGWESKEKLLEDINCFENEYKRNVQSYSYNKLIQGLSRNNMRVESEKVLEDNTIVITISA